MAGFDPFENQGGPAAWDPDTPNTSREVADKLLSKVDEVENDSRPEAQRKEQPDDSDDDPFFTPPFRD